MSEVRKSVPLHITGHILNRGAPVVKGGGSVVLLLLSMLLICLAVEPSNAQTSNTQTSNAQTSNAEKAPVFVDIAQASGLDFVHFNGMSGAYYFPEMTGQGGAFFDYDGDGDLDIYLVQGTMIGPGKSLKDALFPFTGKGAPSDRLFRNDLKNGQPEFVDVTEESQIRATGYGMGVATGDYDRDGHVDLYVTNYGSNQLWRNRGDGTFEETTAKAGVDDPRWSTSTAFFDFDNDGWLDLYVTNYVEFDLEKNPSCYADSSRRDYCGPSAFKSQPDRLFRNRGDGSFEDVTSKLLAGYEASASLGVTAADFNGDHRLDIYIANDGLPNQFWLQQEDGTFRDEALLAGLAVNLRGQPEASMGVAAGDFDGDGDEDIFLTHLTGETNTLYVNDGTGLFEDRSIETKLGANSMSMTAFGTVWLDYDNDGWLDLLALNGAVRVLEELARKGDKYPLDQPNQLFRNLGNGQFVETTAQAGEVFRLAEVSRGTAAGDIDNDGDIDVLICNNNGPARLLQNQIGADRAWLGLRLVDSEGRYLLGSRVAVIRKGQPTLWRRSHTDGSYCSANDPRVLFGLGSAPKIDIVRVIWPGGKAEVWPGLTPGTYTTLKQGSGKKP